MSSELLDRIEARGEARGYQEAVDKTYLEDNKNIMDGLNYTAQQAMGLLKIPADDRPRYLAKLQEKTR